MIQRINRFRHSILTKLFGVGFVIFLSVAGIITVTLLSFIQTRALLSSAIETQMNRMIANSTLTRRLSESFNQTTLRFSLFLDDGKNLEAKRDEWMRQFQTIVTDAEQQGANDFVATLRQFQQQVSQEFETCQHIIETSDAIRELDANLENNLTNLENLLSEALINIGLGAAESDRDAIVANQIATMIPEYRSFLFQIRILVMTFTRAHIGAQQVERAYEQEILTLLDEFGSKLQPVTTNAAATFSSVGKQLSETIASYQTAVTELRRLLLQYQRQLLELQTTQQQITATIAEIDREYLSASENIQENIRSAIRSSLTLVVALSAVVLCILLVASSYALNIVRPIHDLAGVATQVAEGNMSQHLRVKGSKDEIGQLFEAMAYMTDTIQRVTREIERLTQAILQGKLAARGDIQAFSGGWRELIAGVNSVIEAFLIPIENTTNYLGQIARGDLPDEIAAEYRGDFNSIKSHLNLLIASLQDVTALAHKIAGGNVNVRITPRSEHDEFMGALQKMVTYLQEIANVTERIAQNELTAQVAPQSADDMLNHSLQRMIENLRAISAENAHSLEDVRQQNWMRSGQAELGNVMSGEQRLVTLSKNVITYLARYLDLPVGALYLAEERDGETVLQLTGSYAYYRRKGIRSTFKIGESLVGQAALEKECLQYANLPGDYLQVGSGLGETPPRHVLVMPFVYEGELKGVIELGSLDQLTDTQTDFLTQAAANIAITFHTVQNRLKVQALLEATQRQAQELQLQQEHLRVANEELKLQTDALRESEQHLQQQQEELRQTNEELEQQTRALEGQQREMEEKNLALQEARRVIEEKAKDLELSSKYKSEFLANMSHELRTPLNSLLILSNLLRDNKDGNLTAKQVEFAAMINKSGVELLELINGVLDLSKVEAGKMDVNVEEMSLSGLASYIKQAFTHVADSKHLTLDVILEPNAPAAIHSDRQRIEQIVKNFLSNSFKFTERGGVTVRMFCPPETTRLSQSGLKPQEAVAISIADTGIGIPPEKQQLIFEAFQQVDGSTSRKYGGTGLGLSISREFTRLLGGEIHVQSDVGKGSIFTLFLPKRYVSDAQKQQSEAAAHQPQRPSVAPVANTPQPFPSAEALKQDGKDSVDRIRDDRLSCSPGDRSLLIIEDDPNFAKVLFDLGRGRGFKCLIAGDGAAGLQLAYQFLPSAILLDLLLPEIEGETVLEKLQSNPNTRKIPVHIMSAKDMPSGLDNWPIAGYLAKPISANTLEQVFTTLDEQITAPVRRILVVEDDPIASASLLELLGQIAGSEVTATESGEQAYRVLQTSDMDCLILDLGLQDMSGFDLLDTIKADPAIAHLPVIVYTGKDLTKEEERRLQQYTESTIIKGDKSSERLLDEVTLFLRQIETRLPEEQQIKPRMRHDKDAVLHGKNVLLVDDDMRNVYALANVLDDKGMTAIIAENGKEALEQLRDHGDEIHLVLMDIMMPEMDGYEAMRLIRKQPQFHKLPIIALTAKAMKGDRQKCLEAGANDYLSKPIEIDKLLSLLRVWLY